MVGLKGLEPLRPLERQILSLLRLPIPPQPRLFESIIPSPLSPTALFDGRSRVRFAGSASPVKGQEFPLRVEPLDRSDRFVECRFKIRAFTQFANGHLKRADLEIMS